MSATYNSAEQTLTFLGEEYKIYTGEVIDSRVLDILLFKNGDISLQDLYASLLLHDKEMLADVIFTFCNKGGRV